MYFCKLLQPHTPHTSLKLQGFPWPYLTCSLMRAVPGQFECSQALPANLIAPCLGWHVDMNWYDLIWFDMTWYVCKLRSYFIKEVNLRIELSLKPCGSEKVSLLNCTRVATILWMAPGHDCAILLQGSKSGITGIDLFHIKKLPLAQAASGSQKSSCNKATVPYLSSASCLLKGWKDFACWPWVSSSGGPIKILSSNM